MDDMKPPIYCFNGGECIYDKCPRFVTQLDTCGFIVIGLLEGKQPAVQKQVTGSAPSEETLKPTQFHKPPFETGKYVNVQGVIVKTPEYKEGNRKDGTTWQRVWFTLNVDGTEIGTTLWGELAEQAQSFGMGQIVSIKGIQVKEYKGDQQLNSSKYTEILP